VEDAESWGHSQLQAVPRRMIRWGLVRDRALRRCFASDILHWPAPALLDRVDELIAAGTIGGAEPNAADFQILSTVRVLLEFSDLTGQVEGRPSAAAAKRLFPRWDGPIPQFSDGSAGIVESSR
jgi:hypothetical protein